jgi:hypothetical protein
MTEGTSSTVETHSEQLMLLDASYMVAHYDDDIPLYLNLRF